MKKVNKICSKENQKKLKKIEIYGKKASNNNEISLMTFVTGTRMESLI